MSFDENKTITIVPSKLIFEANEAGKIVVSPEVEDQIVNILEFKEWFDGLYDFMKARMGQEMEKYKLVKVEGSKVTAKRQFYGSRFELSDSDLALQTGMAIEKKTIAEDPKAVETYLKTNGDIPEGVKLRDRVQQVSVSLAGEKEKDET